MASVEIDYCSYTKAVEFLGDRWCLLIVRDLAIMGPRGFNELATGLPGHISRSTLTERLRRLEDVGLIRRDGRSPGRQAPYQLTAAGRAFLPTVLALRGWAEEWLPEDPALVERDPSIVMVWMAERLVVDRLPERQVVLDLTLRHDPPIRGWLIIEDGAEPHGCLEDPLLDESRYVYIESSVPTMLALARGHRDPSDVIADGSVEVFGDPALVELLPSWFLPADPAQAGQADGQVGHGAADGPGHVPGGQEVVAVS